MRLGSHHDRTVQEGCDDGQGVVVVDLQDERRVVGDVVDGSDDLVDDGVEVLDHPRSVVVTLAVVLDLVVADRGQVS